MLSCWRCNPEKRPKFNDSEKSLSNILGKTESKHYIDLNEPYLEANESRFKSGETDYLALLGPPDCHAPPVPVDDLQEKYLPFLAKPTVDTLTSTNGLHVGSVTSKSSRKVFNTSEQSFALKKFKGNDLN